MDEHHVMQRAGAHPSGSEEWHCPVCGRRLLLQMTPLFSRTVLAPGDEAVSHSGAAALVWPGLARAEEHTTGGAPLGDDDLSLEMLRPWLKALKAIEEEGYDLL